MQQTTVVTILRADGRQETHEVGRGARFVREWVRRMIGANFLDYVDLLDGRRLVVDDTGAVNDRPVNDVATRLYRAICRPGTAHQIHGDVAVLVTAEVESLP